jgi:hypothetical protein
MGIFKLLIEIGTKFDYAHPLLAIGRQMEGERIIVVRRSDLPAAMKAYSGQVVPGSGWVRGDKAAFNVRRK